jgi:acyl-CoA reductase-like NAD-dependent aldehyde dehydrogenase
MPSTTRPHLIDGQWVEYGPVVDNVSPSDTSDVVDRFGRGDVQLTDRAVGAAVAALPAWAALNPHRRGAILAAVGAELTARADELAHVLAREEGKRLVEARGEVVRASQIFNFFAGECLRPVGELFDSARDGVSIEVTREPVGVVGVITPWNFPIAIPSWKIAPALAYGNTVVLKPAEIAPSSSWHLIEILHRAGVPAGVVNLVTGPGSVVGQAIVDDPRVSAVTFTGSESQGQAIVSAVAARQGKVQCEMGGSNPLIIADDADLNVALNVTVDGSFFSTGQRCTASRRLIVTPGIHDRFIDALCDRVQSLRVGHALDESTDIGPAASASQRETVKSQLRLAAEAGADVRGGDDVQSSHDGYYLAPAVVIGTNNDDPINREEVFGPVAAVIRADDYEHAVALANDTAFGLSAGICTTSLRLATDFKRRSRAGMVMVNVPTAGVDPHVAFGGRGVSSYGPKEQGAAAKEFFTSSKTCYTAT